MPIDKISIRGAREHNLKDVDLDLPRDCMIVITGLSGSGKSSLAFDTIYAEGQRRYIESLSAYARQFLGQMEKPDVDFIEGLSPAVSIDQKATSHNPRSTVGTVTEIYDHLRLLYARVGVPHCPDCGLPIARRSVQQIVDSVQQLPEGTRIVVLGPVVRGRKGEYRQILEDVRKQGFARVRVDGEIRDLTETITLARYRQHWIDVVVDRLVVRPEIQDRLADSMETALKVGEGSAIVSVEGGDDLVFSEKYACTRCERSFEEPAPRMFSFNSPYGACPECKGLGTSTEIDEGLIMPDRQLTLRDGAIAPFRGGFSRFYSAVLRAACDHYGISLDTPLADLPESQVDLLLKGTDEPLRVRYRGMGGRPKVYRLRFPGVLAMLRRDFAETDSPREREQISQYMSLRPCPACKGTRLKPESLAITVQDRNIAEVAALNVGAAYEFFTHIELPERDQIIARQVLKEIRTRLSFLRNVGLSYLTLDRGAATLAGGEGQRIRLATQIGSGLMGVLYILDEPTIGLHQRDNGRLITALQALRDLGNTIIVVEHDEGTIRAADWVVDMGPGAGEHGGEVVAAGSVTEIERNPDSITGAYLSGREMIPTPKTRRASTRGHLEIRGAREHNLKNINVKIPLGAFVCVTGVSGSGKSTLIDEILYRRLLYRVHGARVTWGKHDEVLGAEEIDKVIEIDQSPIGRTPRSNPATYTGAFDPIRRVFTSTPEARARGYKPGRFSFNVKGGRCEACHGDGIIRIEMQFLPDVYVPCEVCKGARYNRETLQVHYKGKTIRDVLEMTVEEALEFFAVHPQIAGKLRTLYDVGLDYLRLGQPATTLSGGEAQRVKLATELSRRATGRTLYLLDEPTSGLHFADIRRLLEVLNRLVDTGNTVVVIEHNLDVIKTADYLIDLGPEGGEEGGYVVATGTPEEVAAVANSYTGQFLAEILGRRPARRARRPRAPAKVG
jgi:excinuclease ABC subunit A